MQSRFKKLSCTAVGGADAERFSIGAEEVTYEGPLQLRLQARFHKRGSKPGLDTRSSANRAWANLDIGTFEAPRLLSGNGPNTRRAVL